MTTTSQGSGNRQLADRLDEFDAFREGRFHVASNERSHAAIVVERDVHNEIAAGHAGDPRVLFVDRVSVQNSAIGPRVLEESRPVPAFHRFEGRDARADQFAAARIAGHQVRLNQAGGDFEIGLDIAAIDPHGDAAGDTPRLACSDRLRPSWFSTR